MYVRELSLVVLIRTLSVLVDSSFDSMIRFVFLDSTLES